MNIKINRETLLKPLTSVASIVEKRHTLPILSNLLIDAKKNQILLTATDLEMQISLSVDSATDADFSTTIAAKKLLDICRSLPDSAEINMATSESRITLKAGKSRFNLQTLPAADYPVMTKTQGDSTLVTIDQRRLKELLKQVEFAMAQQDIRYYLNGLLFEVTGNKLNIVGTDGHRLSFTSTELQQNYEKQEIILPRKTVIELIKLLDDSEEDVQMCIRDSNIVHNPVQHQTRREEEEEYTKNDGHPCHHLGLNGVGWLRVQLRLNNHRSTHNKRQNIVWING